MKSALIATGCLLLALATAGRAEELRTWTSRKGVTVEARLSQISGSQVILQTADGSFLRIEYSALTLNDQLYVSPQADQAVSILRDTAAPSAVVSRRMPSEDVTATEEDSTSALNKWTVRTKEVAEEEVKADPPRNWGAGVNANLNGLGGGNVWQQGNKINQQPVIERRKAVLVEDDDIGGSLLSHKSTSVYDTGRTASDDWSASRKKSEDWYAQQQEEQRERERERQADRIESRAFELESRIKNSAYNSDPDYGGMASEASNLATDSSKLGNRSSSFGFENAASKLRQLDQDQDSMSSSFSSSSYDSDSKRRSAASDVSMGGSSIDRFDTKSTGSRW